MADKPTRFFVGIENKDAGMEANIIIDWSTIGDRPIGIADFDVSSDLPAPCGERAITPSLISSIVRNSRFRPEKA